MSTTARFDHPLYPRYRAERDAQPHGREADHEVAFPGFDEWLTYETEAGYAEDVARVTVPAGAIAARIPRPLAEVAPDLAAAQQAAMPDLLARLERAHTRRMPARHAPTMSAAARRRYTRAGGYGW